MNLRTLPAVLLFAALAAAETPEGPPADPLRYSSGPGDNVSWSVHFSSESLVRRGGTVERLVWNRSGTQRAVGLSRENGRVLFAVENERGPGRVSVYTVDGQDRLKTEGERLRGLMPAGGSDVAFLWLDDRGRGAPVPRDPSLEDAILRVLDEVEVLPEGLEGTWTREGILGELSWKGAFTRTGGLVKADFTFSVPEKGGARVAFDTGTAKLTMLGGWARGVEGKASWTVATKDGTERRELKFSMTGNAGAPLAAEDVADAAADAAPLVSAQEAWRDGERDRALELWDKAGADAGNRWGARARNKAIDARRDSPLLGQAAPALKAPAWIGSAPEAGKWTVVYFWATWIPRCEGELQAIAATLKGRSRVQGASVTRVDALQAEDAVRGAASRLALPFGIALDDGSLARGFKVDQLPRVFVLDAEGKVRFCGSGSETETMKALLDRLVPE